MDFKRLYDDAVKRDQEVRDTAFLELPANICGVGIRQMTPRDFLILEGLGSPLVCGGVPNENQLAAFLWLLSPDYKPGWFRAFLFGRKVRKLNFGEVYDRVRAYLTDTFQDAPGGTSEDGAPFASAIAIHVHILADAYGWTWREIIGTPFTILFQQIKCIRCANGAKELRSRRVLKVTGDRLRMKQAMLDAERGRN